MKTFNIPLLFSFSRDVTRIYPEPGKGTAYTGQVIKAQQDIYVISIGTEHSEALPIPGDLESSGPYTTRTGIGDWVRDEVERISGLGGQVVVQVNDAVLIHAGIEAILGEYGILDLEFSSNGYLPKL